MQRGQEFKLPFVAEPQEEELTAVLMGDQFCLWLPVLGRIKVTPVVVLLKSTDLIPVVRAIMPGGCKVYTPRVRQCDLEEFRGKVAIGLVDGELSDLNFRVMQFLGLKALIGSKEANPRRRWYMRRLSLTHKGLGGVTNKVLTISCATWGP